MSLLVWQSLQKSDFVDRACAVESTLESNVISMSSLIINLATLERRKGAKKKWNTITEIEHLMKFSRGIFSKPANDLQILSAGVFQPKGH